jgi:hypothetical protein
MKKAFTGLFLIFLTGNALAEWVEIPSRYWDFGVFDPNQVVIKKYIDTSSYKSVGTIDTYRVLSEINPRRIQEMYQKFGAKSQVETTRMDCMTAQYLTVSLELYSDVGSKGRVVQSKPGSGQWNKVSEVNEGLYKFICKKDPNIRPQQKETTPLYTPEQREILKDMIRENERRMLLDELDDRINRRW